MSGGGGGGGGVAGREEGTRQNDFYDQHHFLQAMDLVLH